VSARGPDAAATRLSRRGTADGRQRDAHLLQKRGAGLLFPHDLRHRYVSVKIQEGLPMTQIAAHVGHSRESLTLDTYAHVLIEVDK